MKRRRISLREVALTQPMSISPETMLAVLLTSLSAQALWKLGMADGNLPTPCTCQWMFPLRGKWLYRALLGLMVGVMLPFVFVILFGVSTLLCGIGWAVLALVR